MLGAVVYAYKSQLLGRLRQKDHNFKVSFSSLARPCCNIKRTGNVITGFKPHYQYTHTHNMHIYIHSVCVCVCLWYVCVYK